MSVATPNASRTLLQRASQTPATDAIVKTLLRTLDAKRCIANDSADCSSAEAPQSLLPQYATIESPPNS